MAEIQPINLNPGQFHVPQVDFSWLANLPNTFQQGKANALKIDEAQRRQGALAELAKLNPNDPNFAQQVAAAALRMGDVGSAVSAINNAAELKLKQEEAARSAEIGKRFSGAPGTSVPVATPGTPAPVSPAPTLVPPQAAPQTPQVAPGIPALPVTPGGGPSIAPPRTGALLQPQTTQTPPIMAQGGGPRMNPQAAFPPQPPVRVASANGTVPATPWTMAQMQGARRIEQLSPTLRSPFEQMMNDAPESVRKELSLTSGFRTYDEQARLRAEKPTLAARPGHSRHELGEALDLGFASPATKAWVHANAGRYGLGFPMKHEPWHLEPMTARGAGTVARDIQRGVPVGASPRGPYQTAALDPANFNVGNPAVASDISPTPMARTAAVGNQAAGGPASVTNPGGAQPSLLPSPTPLQGALPQMPIPQMSLAALGQPGGVGTIGAPPAGPQTASDASPVQMAQAKPYSPPFQTSAPQAAPPVFQRPPVQAAPVVAPQGAPPVARGASSGAPLAHVSDADLIAASSDKRWGELARAEIARRSAVATDANKLPADWQTYVKAREAGFQGDYIAFKQAERADTTHVRNYAALVADRAARGLGPPEGGLEKYLSDHRGGVTVSTVEEAASVRAKELAKFEIENLKDYKKKSDAAGDTLKTVTAMEAGMKMPGFYAGPLSGKVTLFKQIVDTLGIPVEEAGRLGQTTAGANELISGYSNKLVIDMLGGLGSSVSNADASRASDVVASSDNTPAGMRMKLAVVKATYKRQQEVYRKAAQYYQKNGNLGLGFEQEMIDFAENNPIITDEQLRKAAEGEGAGKSIGDYLKQYPGR